MKKCGKCFWFTKKLTCKIKAPLLTQVLLPLSSPCLSMKSLVFKPLPTRPQICHPDLADIPDWVVTLNPKGWGPYPFSRVWIYTTVTSRPRSIPGTAVGSLLGHPVNGEVGTWFGAFRIPNLVPRSLVNIVGCSSRGRGNCGKLRATSNWASKPVIRSFPSAVRTVEKQLRALASSPPELVVFPRFA